MFNKKAASFGTIIAIIGSILIGVGFAWLIAQNWHIIHSVFKILILLVLTLCSYAVGIFLREKHYPKIGQSLFVLGALLYTLSIFLIAQIFSTSVSLQGTAWLWLFAFLGVTISAYVFSSYVTLVVALIEFLIWINFQFAAFGSNNPPIMFVFLQLVLGILFYSLSLWHKAYDHKFTKLFQFWMAFYFLSFTYTLTFQMFIPMLWGSNQISFASSDMIFLLFLSFISIISFVFAALFSLVKKSVSKREILVVSAIIVLLIGTAFLTYLPSRVMGDCMLKSCYDFDTKELCEDAPEKLKCKWQTDMGTSRCRGEFGGIYGVNSEKNECNTYNNKRSGCLALGECKWESGRSYYGFSRRRSIPGILWFVWIMINTFFVLFILAVIGYGTLEESKALINLGIIAFSLDIVTRYIGFVIDLWGYTSLALIFITGGIVLIVGGWLIEKWRRNLIDQV